MFAIDMSALQELVGEAIAVVAEATQSCRDRVQRGYLLDAMSLANQLGAAPVKPEEMDEAREKAGEAIAFIALALDACKTEGQRDLLCDAMALLDNVESLLEMAVEVQEEILYRLPVTHRFELMSA